MQAVAISNRHTTHWKHTNARLAATWANLKFAGKDLKIEVERILTFFWTTWGQLRWTSLVSFFILCNLGHRNHDEAAQTLQASTLLRRRFAAALQPWLFGNNVPTLTSNWRPMVSSSMPFPCIHKANWQRLAFRCSWLWECNKSALEEPWAAGPSPSFERAWLSSG